MEDVKEPGIIWDYEKVKDRLLIRLCDLQWNQGYLKDKVYTVHGDFAAAYYIAIYEDREKLLKVPVTELLISTWGISMDQLHKDALLADRSRLPALTDLNVLLCSEMVGIGKAENLLAEGAAYHPAGFPMLCLTNSRKQFGASLILHDDILRRAGQVLGSDFFVLPSSIHETILVPDIDGSDAQGLCSMVKEINEEKVEESEQLSDKVQYYDRETGVLENALDRERRLSSLEAGSGPAEEDGQDELPNV
jgi:hypothetical protein